MTLIELMVALAMLGILLPMAAVSLGNLAPKFDLDNAARKTVMVLNQARVQYLSVVGEYNRAQFQLYAALGQPPESALPCAAPRPVEVPVVPPKFEPKDESKP